MKSSLLLTIILLIISLSINAEIITDGSLGSRVNLQGPNYLIGADLGRHKGVNLFHSFQEFNLNSAESATFSGPNSVNNIISRVTGGNPSNIDGLIRSTIPNADMYFLNPYGIVFGENARLDVQGSFHASTADYLRLGENGRFDARNPSDSLLTVAPVEAFGFLTNSPASLSIEGSQLSVPTEKTLSLIGGNLAINLTELIAPFGRLNIAGVAGIGEVIPKYDDFVVPTLRSDIMVKDSLISTSGEGGGAIYIRGEQFVVDNSIVQANTLGAIAGQGIDIQANELTVMQGGNLNSATLATGKSGNITITAKQAVNLIGENSMGEGSFIIIDSYSTGDSGSINLTTKQLNIANGAQIIAGTKNLGQGGDIHIQAEEITLFGEDSKGLRSGIISNSLPNTQDNRDYGNAGKIILEASHLSLKDGAIIGASTNGSGQGGNILIQVDGEVSLIGQDISGVGNLIFANSYGEEDNAGNGGFIEIKAKQLILMDGAKISSRSFGPGSGGNIVIDVDDTVHFIGKDRQGPSGLSVTTNTTGEGGTITLKTKQLLLENNARLDANTHGSGTGGTIHIEVSDLTLAQSRIFANTSSSDSNAGNAGRIEIDADNITLIDEAQISNLTIGLGNAGNIDVTAIQIELKEGARIMSSTLGSGYGGKIIINAEALIASGTSTKGISSGIFSGSYEAQSGSAGNIEIKSHQIRLIEGAKINTATYGTGQGGLIVIKASNSLELIKSYIAANSYLEESVAGDAGNIEIQAGQFNLSDFAIISSYTNGTGQGGTIILKIDDGLKIVGSYILGRANSTQANAGNAGRIEIQAGQMILIEGSQIINDTIGPGRGGTVTIKIAGELLVSGQDKEGYSSIILASSRSSGNAGYIELKASQITIDNKGIISNSSFSSGTGGTIVIEADRLIIADAGEITANSVSKKANAGKAGNIFVSMENSLRMQNGSIKTSTNRADGGDIVINSPGYMYLTDSEITTSVGAEKGDGGNLTLNPEFIVLDSSKIIARAKEGKGGNIDINTTGIYTFPPESASSIDASSELGIDGVVHIESPDIDVSGALLGIPAEFFDASTKLKSPCTIAQIQNPNTFIVKRVGGSAPLPSDWQSNQLVLVQPEDEQNPNSKTSSPITSLEVTEQLALKVALLTGCQSGF